MPVDIELRKAAAYISSGRNEAAYKILSKFLKDFPDSDLAWLLLSYVIEDPRKQMASVTRALKLNPQNTDAKNRLDKLMATAAEQSPGGPGSNGDHLQDWPSIFTNPQSDFDDGDSRPLSVEERLAFVTLETESPRGYVPRDYPTQSFYTDRPIDRGFDDQGKSSIRPKHLLIGGVSLILIVVAIILTIKFLNGGFISKADAEATASIETAVAFATREARGRLPPTWTPTITQTVTLTAVPTTTPTTPTTTPTPTFDLPDPTVSAEIGDLQDQVSALRELPSQETVNSYIVMRSKVRTLLLDYYFSDENANDELHDTSIVLTALGLIIPEYDLLTNLLNSFTDGVGGFYLHEVNQIYIVGFRFSAIEKFIYAHEYDHALVDQSFNLSGLNLYPRCDGNEDRCKAIQALVEGDATLLMMEWLDEAATDEEYDEIMRYQPPSGILPEQNPPPYAVQNSGFPYNQGLNFVDTLYDHGGWTRINQAYSSLPMSTEQILHPEKYLSGEGPLDVSLVSLESVLDEDWRLVRNNTLGEWMTYLILGYSIDQASQVGELDAVRASEGWGGDNYQVYYKEKSDDTVLVVQWRWDENSDLDEFTHAMRFYLERRLGSMAIGGTTGECWENNKEATCLYSADRQSLWIVGPSIKLVQSIKELYPEFH
jgi:hypothetical protein